MLTKLKESIKKLESSKTFKDYKKTNPDAYLTSTFLMAENLEEDWQLDYYSIKSKKITSFVIKDKIKSMPETKPFQEKETIIEKLDIDKIKIDFKKVLEIADKLKKEKYKNETLTKKIIVLQNLKEFGQIWNLTFLTSSFKTLNIKINASSGKILKENLASLITFTKK